MAKPPSGYPGPQGYPCGKTWKESIIVDGSIPGKNYGKQFTHTIPPVIEDLQTGAGKLGWDSPYEKGCKEKLFNRLEDAVEQLRIAEVWFSAKEVRSIEWLIEQAAAELDEVRKIHLQWNFRDGGPYPLSYADTLEAFPSAKYWQDCANPGDILRPAGPHWGFTVPGTGDLGDVVCPTRSTMDRRKRDRATIAERFVDAAHFIRCAEYGIWRLTLYRKAVDAWKDSIAGSGPRDLRVTPGTGRGPGGFTTPTAGPPPPPTPSDLKLPTPPPGPLPPQPTPTGPDDVTTPTRSTHASKKRKSSSTGTVLLGGAALGLGLWAFNR
jgi:hypothetical protein